jgi:excisionase family DNA binding protein
MISLKRPKDGGKGRDVISTLLTVAEASKYLGVAHRKIYQLIEWGEIRGVKLGRAVKIEKESLDQFRDSRKLT